MTEQEGKIKRAHRVLAALETAIEKGPWDKSKFLSIVGKKLKEYRYRLKRALESNEVRQAKPLTLADRIAERRGLVEVYVSLYNADGASIPKWDKLVQGITKQALTRPIYRREEDVRAMVRSKIKKKNEAYVAVYVKVDEIVKPDPDKPLKDRLGHELITLRDNAIKPNNVTRLMHSTGRYQYIEDRLVRKGDIEYKDFL